MYPIINAVDILATGKPAMPKTESRTNIKGKRSSASAKIRYDPRIIHDYYSKKTVIRYR